jgi:hypothetical protein
VKTVIQHFTLETLLTAGKIRLRLPCGKGLQANPLQSGYIFSKLIRSGTGQPRQNTVSPVSSTPGKAAGLPALPFPL